MKTPQLPPTVGLVLHFRHAEHTAACIYSLSREDVAHVMVVDNSEDCGASLQMLLERIDAYAIDVSIYEPGRNLGFAAGVNRGLAKIRARHGRACVLLINNDARLQRNAHARLRRALSDKSGLAVPRIRYGKGRYIDSMFYQRASGLLLRHHWPGSYEHFSGCCMLLRPDLALGPLFDEDFFFYGEDAELGWRLQRDRVSQRKVPEAVVEHDASTGSRNGSLFYEYHMVRAHWLLARKLASSRFEWAFNLSGRVIFLPLRAVLRSIRQRSMTPVQGGLMATMDALRGECRPLTPPAGSQPNDGDEKTRLHSP